METIINHVMKSKEYKKFSFIKGNRPIDRTNAEKIKKSMIKKQLIIPIIINEQYGIIDGQHRYIACKELGLPLYYILAQGYGEEEMIIANASGGKKWATKDYLNKYKSMENSIYIYMDELLDIYELKADDLVRVISLIKSEPVIKVKDEFKMGTLELDETEVIEKFLDAWDDFKIFSGRKRGNFITAFSRLYFRDGYNHEQMKKKIETYGANLAMQSSVDDYLAMLCNKIYSYGRCSNKILYSVETRKFHK